MVMDETSKIRLLELGILLTDTGLIAKKAKLHIEAPVNIAGQIGASGVIGAYTYIRKGSFINRCTHIGRYCSIARNVTIGEGEHPSDWLSTHPFQYGEAWVSKRWSKRDNSTYAKREVKQAVWIGHDVTIGDNAIILLGVRIGTGAIIGAGAVVTKDVPPFAVVAGVPAKVIKFRHPETIRAEIHKFRWWRYEADSLAELPFDNVVQALGELKEREKAGLLEPIEDSFVLIKDGAITKRDRRSWIIEDIDVERANDAEASCQSSLMRNLNSSRLPQAL